MKKIAVLQSNYIPWKGYFDLIAYVDEFIIYDEVQFTKNDWRNRNRIKTPNGVQWITIPVSQGIDQKIMDVKVANQRWRIKHWKTLEANYRNAPCFSFGQDFLSSAYDSARNDNLSEINLDFIRLLTNQLGITTRITKSTDYDLRGDSNQRLIDLCKQSGAGCYVSGPAARAYLNIEQFVGEGLSVEWFSYDGYPEYPQLWGGFAHDVSILDLIFNTGPDSTRYMKFVR